MRIIGGKNKGHKFYPPKKKPARPTTNIAKEGLFNILNNNFYFEDVVYLDLFGGTGSISYEMASRGCENITLIERHYPNINFIKETASKLDFKITALKMDVFKFIKTTNLKFDLIFAGPPYPLKNIPDLPELVLEFGLLKDEDSWFVLEHNPDHSFEAHSNFLRVKNYGSTIFSFFHIGKIGRLVGQ